MASGTESTADASSLPPDLVDRLLALLSENDAFRATFQANPVAALAELGHAPAQALLAAGASAPVEGQPYYCMTSQVLASKEEIAAARQDLLSYLTCQGNKNVIYSFEAGKVETIFRRN